MQLKLEELPYQQRAISAVVRLFEGQERNTPSKIRQTDQGESSLCKWQSKEGRQSVTTKCHRLKLLQLAENAMHEALKQ